MKNSYDVSPQVPKLNREFIARRLQSLAGFVFLLFLCEHLFTNSQAALFVGDDGRGFIDAVNWIHSLPYLPVVELAFIASPILLHVWWGIERVRMAKFNSGSSDGAAPTLAYSRNIAFSWQRITSIILIVAILMHVIYMRFLHQPHEHSYGVFREFFVKVTDDPGLSSVASRLDVKLTKDGGDVVLASANNVGTAFLLVLRDTYKSIVLCLLYSIFVVIASFHACNGLWTFAITWGVTLNEGSRRLVRIASNLLMGLLIFFGLACIWGVYWVNLRS
jgi:succinate dehydrogenase / fumarate reductase cytochrome b subunit